MNLELIAPKPVLHPCLSFSLPATTVFKLHGSWQPLTCSPGDLLQHQCGMELDQLFCSLEWDLPQELPLTTIITLWIVVFVLYCVLHSFLVESFSHCTLSPAKLWTFRQCFNLIFKKKKDTYILHALIYTLFLKPDPQQEMPKCYFFFQ